MSTVIDSPIVALCTPQGSGAIALIRISGEETDAVVTRMSRLSSKRDIRACKTHTINHGFVVDKQGQIIDEVLFLIMRKPHSFTGEHTIEITSHNNPFIIEAIIHRAIACGARLAQAGEFSERAFLHGKLDLMQAEALHEVITGTSQQAVKKAMAQLQGTLSAHMRLIDHLLQETLCFVEASFEFLDEEQRDLSFDAKIRDKLTLLQSKLHEITASFGMQEQIRQGVRIAFIGTVNAGKSTLFNAIIGKDRAIVTDQEGTTRDAIEASISRDGLFWTLVDTAGMRNTSDIIEQKGIEKTFDEAVTADIILLIEPAGVLLANHIQQMYEKIRADHGHKIVWVCSKIDMAPPFSQQYDSMVSVHENRGISGLRDLLQKRVKQLFAKTACPYLLSGRQQAIVRRISQQVDEIMSETQAAIAYEILAYRLRDCLVHITELTGQGVSEQLLDSVFRSFCVGK